MQGKYIALEVTTSYGELKLKPITAGRVVELEGGRGYAQVIDGRVVAEFKPGEVIVAPVLGGGQ